MNRHVFGLVVFLSLFPPPAQADDGETVYNTICYYCHDDGLIGAPKIGDIEDWAERQKKGQAELFHNTLKGTGHMMGRLHRVGYTKTEILNALKYLLEHSK